MTQENITLEHLKREFGWSKTSQIVLPYVFLPSAPCGQRFRLDSKTNIPFIDNKTIKEVRDEVDAYAKPHFFLADFGYWVASWFNGIRERYAVLVVHDLLRLEDLYAKLDSPEISETEHPKIKAKIEIYNKYVKQHQQHPLAAWCSQIKLVLNKWVDFILSDILHSAKKQHFKGSSVPITTKTSTPQKHSLLESSPHKPSRIKSRALVLPDHLADIVPNLAAMPNAVHSSTALESEQWEKDKAELAQLEKELSEFSIFPRGPEKTTQINELMDRAKALRKVFLVRYHPDHNSHNNPNFGHDKFLNVNEQTKSQYDRIKKIEENEDAFVRLDILEQNMQRMHQGLEKFEQEMDELTSGYVRLEKKYRRFNDKCEQDAQNLRDMYNQDLRNMDEAVAGVLEKIKKPAKIEKDASYRPMRQPTNLSDLSAKADDLYAELASLSNSSKPSVPASGLFQRNIASDSGTVNSTARSFGIDI